MADERLAISRLYWRFGFGPKPGEFKAALGKGLTSTQNELLTPHISSIALADPIFDDVGPRPQAGTRANVEYSLKVRQQNKDLILWWLNRMAQVDHALEEKMTWFWHGHWATSIDKNGFARPMYLQNTTLRTHALGDFSQMAQAMFNDGALQYWLDGQDNVATAPNENLSREMMELFLLGVGNYTEGDVKELARAFTGYRTSRTGGGVTFTARRHDARPITLLGRNLTSDAAIAINHLLAQNSCQTFIPQRLWYRLINSDTAHDSSIELAFNQRLISTLVFSLGISDAMSNPTNSMVKAPVEWFIGICRSLGTSPSALGMDDAILRSLTKLAQIPFSPPNVGGWPTNEAWLNAASAQFRLAFSGAILKKGDLTFLGAVAPAQRVGFLADHLGVYRWSPRTESALTGARQDVARMYLLAINSPEYVVSA